MCRFLDPLQVALPPALVTRRPVRGIARGRLLEDSPALGAAKIIGMAGVYGGDIHIWGLDALAANRVDAMSL